MIISASYKTDIPAFYADWFMNRLREGYCRVKNPYGGQLFDVSLAPENVDGFVFWTRNIRPLMDHLEAIRLTGPMVVQFTVTNYPRAIETSVIPAHKALEDMKTLADHLGSRAVVWRYDPVVVSDITPPHWHLVNFEALAGALEGVVDEVVMSFMHVYAKSKRNMDAAALKSGFHWTDPPFEEKQDLLSKLAVVAKKHGMKATLCAQPDLLTDDLVPAACIDAKRLVDVGGRLFSAKQKGNRPGCLCAESRDIGAYDTCPHGCAYCYATRHQEAAKENYRDHNPWHDMLG
ncbi:DUF1848 domain-containing protein [Aestuariispira ectoiniformans]|uniref:DUF1848 domain-containing protein n=1 Tax=Aestuariispira ectoiniformans TaxID=2775080 RepID=UPI00223B620F|nr:DUF1848 domain-containing protein [Aestuariispira ectoiniformans]